MAAAPKILLGAKTGVAQRREKFFGSFFQKRTRFPPP
jgi:hypothetical protein